MQTDLLALDFARVTRHETSLAQNRLERCVIVDQRAGDAVACRAGLAGLAATGPGWVLPGVIALLVSLGCVVLGILLSRAFKDASAGGVVAASGLPYAFAGGAWWITAWYASGIVAHIVALVWLMTTVVKDVLDPARDPVRRTALDQGAPEIAPGVAEDPHAGVFTGARDRLLLPPAGRGLQPLGESAGR